MERFLNLTLDELGARYMEDEVTLVCDLVDAGLLHGPPTCHGSSMMIYASKPWHWRCTCRTCCKTVAVVTDDCFLKGFKDRYAVLKATYMWCYEFSPSQIRQQCRLSKPTVIKVIKLCRDAVLPDGIASIFFSHRVRDPRVP